MHSNMDLRDRSGFRSPRQRIHGTSASAKGRFASPRFGSASPHMSGATSIRDLKDDAALSFNNLSSYSRIHFNGASGVENSTNQATLGRSGRPPASPRMERPRTVGGPFGGLRQGGVRRDVPLSGPMRTPQERKTIIIEDEVDIFAARPSTRDQPARVLRPESINRERSFPAFLSGAMPPPPQRPFTSENRRRPSNDAGLFTPPSRGSARPGTSGRPAGVPRLPLTGGDRMPRPPATARGRMQHMEVTDSILPEKYHIMEKSIVMPQGATADDVDVEEKPLFGSMTDRPSTSGNQFRTRSFPRAVPSARAQAQELYRTYMKMEGELAKEAGDDESSRLAPPPSNAEDLMKQASVPLTCLVELMRQTRTWCADNADVGLVLTDRLRQLVEEVSGMSNRSAQDLKARQAEVDSLTQTLDGRLLEAEKAHREREMLLKGLVKHLEKHLDTQEREIDDLTVQLERREILESTKILTEQQKTSDTQRFHMEIQNDKIGTLERELTKTKAALAKQEALVDAKSAQLETSLNEQRNMRQLLMQVTGIEPFRKVTGPAKNAGSREADSAMQSDGELDSFVVQVMQGSNEAGLGQWSAMRAADEYVMDRRRHWQLERLRLLQEIADLRSQTDGDSGNKKMHGGNIDADLLNGLDTEVDTFGADIVFRHFERKDPVFTAWSAEKELLYAELFRLRRLVEDSAGKASNEHPLPRRCIYVPGRIPPTRNEGEGFTRLWLQRMIYTIYTWTSLRMTVTIADEKPSFSEPFPEQVWACMLSRYPWDVAAKVSMTLIGVASDHRGASVWIDLFAQFLSERLPLPALQLFLHILQMVKDSPIGISYPETPETSFPHWICLRRCGAVIKALFQQNLTTVSYASVKSQLLSYATEAPPAEVEVLGGNEAHSERRIELAVFCDVVLKHYLKELLPQRRAVKELFQKVSKGTGDGRYIELNGFFHVVDNTDATFTAMDKAHMWEHALVDQSRVSPFFTDGMTLMSLLRILDSYGIFLRKTVPPVFPGLVSGNVAVQEINSSFRTMQRHWNDVIHPFISTFYNYTKSQEPIGGICLFPTVGHEYRQVDKTRKLNLMDMILGYVRADMEKRQNFIRCVTLIRYLLSWIEREQWLAQLGSTEISLDQGAALSKRTTAAEFLHNMGLQRGILLKKSLNQSRMCAQAMTAILRIQTRFRARSERAKMEATLKKKVIQSEFDSQFGESPTRPKKGKRKKKAAAPKT